MSARYAMVRAKSAVSHAPEAPLSQMDAEHPLASAAEEVRAFFVAARGGAPFLSGADGAQLARWLEDGLPVSLLLRAVEATAARRVARRARAPFTLRSIGPALKKVDAPPARTLAAPPPDDLPEASPGAEALASGARAALAARTERDPERRARAGCAIVRAFQEALWSSLGDELSVLRALAAEALAEARNDVDDELFDAMCDEWVRARLRERYPDLTATRIWEEANDAG